MKKILLLIALFLFVGCEETSSSEDNSFENPIVVLDDVDSSPVSGEEDGVENGLWTQWYLNGKKRYEGNIKGEEGFRTEWYENGQKKEDWDINDGDGKVTYWFENGQKEFENTYKDGKEVPKSYKEWNEDGSVKEVKKEYKTIKELFGSP